MLSTALVYLGLGGFLVVSAASALGKAPSSPLRARRAWLGILLPFPILVFVGQLLAENPGEGPWLFPFVNVAMVSLPSIAIALFVAGRYQEANPLSWPISRREFSSGFVYGAIGATTVAGIINTIYILAAGTILVHRHGADLPFSDFDTALRTLPRGWGIFLDLTTISVVAPLNEEFWKGMLVAFFFFRKGGAARCFTWGVLAGAGFNLLETFSNSLAAVSPEAAADTTLGSEWWFFALARTGTAAMHATATGLVALGFYGAFRRRPEYLGGLIAGPLIHAAWNFLVYCVWGDGFLTGAGPDSRWLDLLGGAGLIALFLATVLLLWAFSGRLRDEAPAHIYRLIGMAPAGVARRLERPPQAPPAFEGAWADAAGLPSYGPPSTAGSGPGGTLATSARGSTQKRIGVSPA